MLSNSEYEFREGESYHITYYGTDYSTYVDNRRNINITIIHVKIYVAILKIYNFYCILVD